MTIDANPLDVKCPECLAPSGWACRVAYHQERIRLAEKTAPVWETVGGLGAEPPGERDHERPGAPAASGDDDATARSTTTSEAPEPPSRTPTKPPESHASATPVQIHARPTRTAVLEGLAKLLNSARAVDRDEAPVLAAALAEAVRIIGSIEPMPAAACEHDGDIGIMEHYDDVEDLNWSYEWCCKCGARRCGSWPVRNSSPPQPFPWRHWQLPRTLQPPPVAAACDHPDASRVLFGDEYGDNDGEYCGRCGSLRRWGYEKFGLWRPWKAPELAIVVPAEPPPVVACDHGTEQPVGSYDVWCVRCGALGAVWGRDGEAMRWEMPSCPAPVAPANGEAVMYFTAAELLRPPDEGWNAYMARSWSDALRFAAERLPRDAVGHWELLRALADRLEALLKKDSVASGHGAQGEPATPVLDMKHPGAADAGPPSSSAVLPDGGGVAPVLRPPDDGWDTYEARSWPEALQLAAAQLPRDAVGHRGLLCELAEQLGKERDDASENPKSTTGGSGGVAGVVGRVARRADAKGPSVGISKRGRAQRDETSEDSSGALSVDGSAVGVRLGLENSTDAQELDLFRNVWTSLWVCSELGPEYERAVLDLVRLGNERIQRFRTEVKRG